MRNDKALLLDILIAGQKILKFTSGLTETEFDENELVQSAVIREIQVIGEAARLISEETKSMYAELDWTAMSSMRNRVVHEYFNIDLGIVWDTIRVDIPKLIRQVKPLIPEDEET